MVVSGIADTAPAERRAALVIGNGAYSHAGTLLNPPNDARAVAAALGRLGFAVQQEIDLAKAQFDQALRRFAGSLAGAEVGLVFYAGHGLQVHGVNYLVPVDAVLEHEADLDFETVGLDLVLRQLERNTPTALIVLDACRNNPLARNLARSMGTNRSAAVGRGLARVETHHGTLVAFSTNPDNVAADGIAGAANSPFTAALLHHLETPGLEIRQMLTRVRREVMQATGGQQVPWDSSSLLDEFYLKPALPAPAVPAPPTDPAVLARTNEIPVRDIQWALQGLGHYAGPIDDRMGEDTRRAIRTYQQSIGAPQTGELSSQQIVSSIWTAAGRGHKESQTTLGWMYANGRGVRRDEAEAARLYRLAADQGDARAQNNLGWMYANGRGVRRDEAEAVRFYRRAADQGYARAQSNLGVMYEHGRGVRKDEAEAVRLYRLAVAQGDAAARENLSRMGIR